MGRDSTAGIERPLVSGGMIVRQASLDSQHEHRVLDRHHRDLNWALSIRDDPEDPDWGPVGKLYWRYVVEAGADRDALWEEILKYDRKQRPIEDPERATVVRWGTQQAESTIREADARVGEFKYEYKFESDEDVEGSDDSEGDSNDDAGCTSSFATLPALPDDDDEDNEPDNNGSDLDLDNDDTDADDSDDDESVIRDKFRFHRWLTSDDDDDNNHGDAAQHRQFWRSRFAIASPHGGNDE